MDPRTSHFLLEYFNGIKTDPWHILKDKMFHISKIWKPMKCQFSKIRSPKNDEDPSNQILKSWIWDQYLPENMTWKFGEFLKPRNRKTIKL